MENNNVSKKKIFTVPIILTIIMWIILFLPAGTMKFWQAWIFWLGFSIITFFITGYFIKRNPEFLARRTNTKQAKESKKTPLFFKAYYLGFILPGIDFRFHWSNEPLWLVILSNIIAFLAYIFIFYVFKENSYASTVIQVENEQKVISSGPYKVVRHPMYLGMIIMMLFMPLALGSYFSIIPMALIMPIIVIRIKNEEETLLKELNGYKEYSSKIRYRLIPLIW
ncbi:Protein-S-isoprenylcysteine O-methyltransferase Ste14 [Clostridium cavendishii DSM 21758]|uniref:Protein-S-isoprenylcysteine O-methyltransferase Ste14 n=1 Tax=Clostridium cavendishii DSM 21758 TaxID=1121302 RepID=A0A1M6GQS8_9CLOT|nr:isoprenylcysteine carboxylmethyltransferase family protein [Clostridium cavendishii]SHJ12250.1 Protein-S-isoprenylcysteine O-methyltransferase Ste14 [Clostridium cavendishii DSM 21758]